MIFHKSDANDNPMNGYCDHTYAFGKNFTGTNDEKCGSITPPNDDHDEPDDINEPNDDIHCINDECFIDGYFVVDKPLKGMFMTL